MNDQALLAAVSSPGVVIDRDGTQWTRQTDGTYRALFYSPYPLDVLRDTVGPLTTPKGDPA